jgi:hypothetical protein
MFCVAILLRVVRMSSVSRILGDASTDPRCCRPTRSATPPGEGSSGATEEAVRIGQVGEDRPVTDPQGSGDLQTSQTLGTDDLGPALACLRYALLPAPLCQRNPRIQAYEALLSP